MRCLVMSVICCALAACAPKGLYQWGDYDGLLYRSYKSPEKFEEMRVALEAHILSLESSKQVVAPGLYAEVGTLHLQKGDRVTAARWYQREHDAWPESRPLMKALITTAQSKPASAPQP